jgi:two-component system OmpR family response regulator
MNLLLLEDDEAVGEDLCALLRREGHHVLWCTTLGQAQAASLGAMDLLLIDWSLPDGSGVEWLRGLRARGYSTPAFLLTERDRVCDRIEGLDSGADDTLVKPCDGEELCARLRAQARRMGALAPRRIFGEVEIDLEARVAYRLGEEQELTAREWSVVEALVQRAGRIMLKRDLAELVFGQEAEIASNALEVHIFHLRRKLGRAFIETVRGLGYRTARQG